MDPKELRGLYEAYNEVYAPQENIEEASYSAKAARAGKDIGKPGKQFAKIAKEAGKRYGSEERGKKVAGAVLAKLRAEDVEIDEAVKGESSERREDLAAERRGGHRPLSKKEGENYASHKLAQMAYVKRKRMGEELDLFDVVLEFLQVEGYAETLEEAEWMMANIIDEEAIDIILGEEQLDEISKELAGRVVNARIGRTGRAFDKEMKDRTPENMRASMDAADKEARAKRLAAGVRTRRNAANEEYMDEAQVANRDPDKYEAGQQKKYAPVRGERTPMPPRGNKRREDFEKWYAANVR